MTKQEVNQAMLNVSGSVAINWFSDGVATINIAGRGYTLLPDFPNVGEMLLLSDNRMVFPSLAALTDWAAMETLCGG